MALPEEEILKEARARPAGDAHPIGRTIMETQTLSPPVSAITARLLNMLLRATGHEGGEPACGQLPPGPG